MNICYPIYPMKKMPSLFNAWLSKKILQENTPQRSWRYGNNMENNTGGSIRPCYIPFNSARAHRKRPQKEATAISLDQHDVFDEWSHCVWHQFDPVTSTVMSCVTSSVKRSDASSITRLAMKNAQGQFWQRISFTTIIPWANDENDENGTPWINW